MRKYLNQNGTADPLLIPLVVAVVLLIGFAGFGIWSYTSYLDASKVEQAEIDEAVDEAEAKLTEDLEVAFAEREKQPTKTYTSPAQSGSVEISYPKYWSVYSDESESDGNVDTYVNPSYVRSLQSESPVAIRMTITNDEYSREVERFDDLASEGLVKIKPIKSSGITGLRIDGTVMDDFEGAMVMFPVRDKTLMIWTESTSFLSDFNDIVVKNLKFSP